MSDDARMVPVYLLGFVLVVVLLMANVVIAADRTALDSEHTIETFGEEDVYSDVTTIVQEDAVERVNETIEAEKEQRIEDRTRNRDLSQREEQLIRQGVDERLPDRAQQEEFVEEAITTGFVERELTRNLETIYAVLHGEQSDGEITVRIGDQKEQLNQSIRETLGDDPRINEDEIIATVSGEIPDEENLTEGGEVPSEVEGASAGVGFVGTLTWLLPALALGLVGGMFHFTGRDLRRTARSGGTGFAIAGILGAVIGFGLGAVATGAAESALDADSAEVAAMSDGVVAVVDSLFGTVVMQGLLIAAIGLIAVGAVIAEERGYLDDLLGDDQPAQQGQYQQGQYQQGQQGQYNDQYQQGQHAQQGQYQEGRYDQQNQYAQQDQYQEGQYDQQNQYAQQDQYQEGQYDQQGQYQQDQYQEGQQYEQSQYQQGQTDQQPQGDQYTDQQTQAGQSEAAEREGYDDAGQHEQESADSDETDGEGSTADGDQP